ncbi:hypothetical protein LOTGIDRAFT_175478 [Lottia gigantea]|uniref:Uncharacterized protein n=1 Tax=Lottia gigantea TaxID=225164 RepID=V3ZSG4_LOTGI|nr:hypothetical protein LOTGIDRAFT_175478 [Lottia gigantea]ESO94363.1 hypothetical protein LOTGIDRAFT_175478 [Lottia gigantea]
MNIFMEGSCCIVLTPGKVNLTCGSPWTNQLVITQTPTTAGGKSLYSDSIVTTARIPMIVGCIVGGVVLVSVIIVIVICFRKRRNQKPQNDQNVLDQNIRNSDRNIYLTTIPDRPSQIQHQNTTDTLSNTVYSSLDSRYNTSSDLKPYEQLPKLENSLTEHQEDVPHIDNDYDIVVEGSSPDNEIPSNNVYSSPDPRNNTSSDYRLYEHLPKQENDNTEQQEHVSELQEDVLFTNNDYVKSKE